MRSQVCDLLGIEYPILAFCHCRDVVAAVSKAGGMGVLGAVTHTRDELEVALDWIDAEVDGAPYGVDLLMPTRYVREEKGPGATPLADMIPPEHAAFVRGIVERYELAPVDPSVAPPRDEELTFDDQVQQIVDAALAHPIRLLASALGPPPPELVTEAHARGIAVAALAGTRQHAERHVLAGVDLVVAQGYEAAGHTGEIGSLVLVPEIVDAVAPVPVVAAGGIVRGRQMAAAMALGAQGVWCGSIWLTT
jgi:NAD(P)H-dependent flavin oxidoreductase YrpB (nitropropane dioxygenase family)